jgi:two-component system cell cycle response regulator
MTLPSAPVFLLASHDPVLLNALEPALAVGGAGVEIVLSAEAALRSLVAGPAPTLALLDESLPGLRTEHLLAAARGQQQGKRLPIVLISDRVTQNWTDRLIEGEIDDLLPRSIEPAFVRLRLEAVLRSRRLAREVEMLRETAAREAQTDHLTGVFNREAMMSLLFRETDRVQRMKNSLAMILFDIDDFGHWNSMLGTAICDELLRQVVARTHRMLRSYDLFGRVGKDEFLLALPGCSSFNAVTLAERLRVEVFSVPFHVEGEAIRLSACFGIASSLGRSPVVVLREAEEALKTAQSAGPETIECTGECPKLMAAAVAFLSPTSGDELRAW